MIIHKQRTSLLFLLITATLISVTFSRLQNSNFNITERKVLLNLEDKSNENIFNSSLFFKGLNKTDLRLTYSNYNYNNKNNYKQIVYSTSYPDNNVTGTGNMLEDAIYRTKCKILDCSNCCSGEINSMYCENANTCQIYFDHQSFMKLLPLIIILSIYGFIFICLIIYGCMTKENAWEGMKFALLGIFYCIVFPFIGFFYAIAMILCCDMKTNNNSNSVKNKQVVLNHNNNYNVNIKNNVQEEDIDKKSENNSILIIHNNMNNGEGGINIKQIEKNDENSGKNDELNKQQTILPPGGSEAIDGGSNLTNNNPGVIINKPTEKDSEDDKNFNNNFS